MAEKNSARNSARPACANLIVSFSLRSRNHVTQVIAEEVLAEKKTQDRQDDEALELHDLHDHGRIGAVGARELLALMRTAHGGIDEAVEKDNLDEAQERCG